MRWPRRTPLPPAADRRAEYRLFAPDLAAAEIVVRLLQERGHRTTRVHGPGSHPGERRPELGSWWRIESVDDVDWPGRDDRDAVVETESAAIRTSVARAGAFLDSAAVQSNHLRISRGTLDARVAAARRASHQPNVPSEPLPLPRLLLSSDDRQVGTPVTLRPRVFDDVVDDDLVAQLEANRVGDLRGLLLQAVSEMVDEWETHEHTWAAVPVLADLARAHSFGSEGRILCLSVLTGVIAGGLNRIVERRPWLPPWEGPLTPTPAELAVLKASAAELPDVLAAWPEPDDAARVVLTGLAIATGVVDPVLAGPLSLRDDGLADLGRCVLALAADDLDAAVTAAEALRRASPDPGPPPVVGDLTWVRATVARTVYDVFGASLGTF